MPLGASIGPAGLAVMPYTLTFKGNFFHVADFIHGLDSLVKTNNEKVEVTGRLITINASPSPKTRTSGSRPAKPNFTVTTFLVPPEQGVTAGATPTSPEPSTTPGLDHDRRDAVKRLGPELKMPKFKGGQTKVPPFLSDLYYDLRDRRLLPVVAADPGRDRRRSRSCSRTKREKIPPPPVPTTTSPGSQPAAAKTLTVVKAAPGPPRLQEAAAPPQPDQPLQAALHRPGAEGLGTERNQHLDDDRRQSTKARTTARQARRAAGGTHRAARHR